MKNIRTYQLFCLFLFIVVVVLILNRKSNESSPTIDHVKLKKEITLSVIQNRKSVRNYISDKKVSDEDIRTITRAGMSAPSGRDLRPWEIIVIDDRGILNSLAEKLPYAKMLAHAPLAMIVCGDSELSSYWYLDCSAVTQNILLAVEALELGAVWTAVYPYDDRTAAILDVINLPDNILPLNIIPIGYPEGEQKVKDKFDESKIHLNKW